MTDLPPEAVAAPKAMPWAPFYFADWLGDEKLLLCSLGARGLWMHILCLMHKSQRRGYLLKPNSQPYSLEELALSTQSKLSEIRKFWLELEGNCVFSRDGGGLVFSRRMVRDIEKHEDAKNRGVKGGNPALKKTAPPDAHPPSGLTSGLTSVLTSGLTSGLTCALNPRDQRPETRDQSVVGGHQVVGATAPDGGSADAVVDEPASARCVTNHPTEAVVAAHFAKHAPGVFTAEEIRRAFLSFEAAAVDGYWMWRNRPVTDWRAAFEVRLGDDRKKPAHVGGAGQASGRVTPLLPSQELKQLDTDIHNHPANLDGPNSMGAGCVPENLAKSFRQLLDRRDALGRQLPTNA